MNIKYTGHVVSSTHWDREWYRPFQVFRMRLVDMVDNLIDLMESNPQYRYFTFDGQVITIDDYLAIRPEKEARLRKLINDGRIHLGPWYNQPDEFIVSGECLIRNLLTGLEKCRDYGGYLASGYVPDCFGHISQLPQILAGFGIDNAIFFRGITMDQSEAQFIWESPDETQVLAIKLPDKNAYSAFLYSFLETLRKDDIPIDREQVINEFKNMLSDCLNERPTSSQFLLMDGVDHVFAQPKTPQIIDIVNESQEDMQLIHSTIPAFLEEFRKESPELEIICGELRWSNRKWGIQSILAHVLSSRIDIKQASYKCETLLEKYAEPLCTWAWVLGHEYPKAYLNLAWEYLLKNSPHDSICGCSLDQVHRDMQYRFDQSRIICEQLIREAAGKIAQNLGHTCAGNDNTFVFAVFNTLAHKRTEVITADVFVPGNLNIAGVHVLNSAGEEIPGNLISVDRPWNLKQTPHDIPRDPGQQRIRVAFKADDVPGIGYKTFALQISDKPNRQPSTLQTGINRAENEYISVQIESDGTITLTDKLTGKKYTNLMVFEDGGDIGDGYRYIAPQRDSAVFSTGCRHRISIEENSPVRIIFKVVTDMEIPATMKSNKLDRSDETAICQIETYITLAAGIPHLDIKSIVTNNSEYHRLRVMFPTELNSQVSYSETAFDVVERNVSIPVCTDWIEPMPSTQPQKSFVSLSDGASCFTLINRGIQEYEVMDDGSGTIGLTLLRANYGWPGEEGPVRDSQLQGLYIFEYSILTRPGDWEQAYAYEQAHSFNTPFIAVQAESQNTDMPCEVSFTGGDSPFVLSAVKRSESGDAVIIRGYNISTAPADVVLYTGDFKSACSVDLKEDVIEELQITDQQLQLHLRQKQIVSVKLTR